VEKELKPSSSRNGKAPFQCREAQPTVAGIDGHRVALLAFDGPSNYRVLATSVGVTVAEAYLKAFPGTDNDSFVIVFTTPTIGPFPASDLVERSGVYFEIFPVLRILEGCHLPQCQGG
jgi:hypothetical protein